MVGRRTGLKIQAAFRPQFKQKMLRSMMMGCYERKEYFSGKLLKYTLKADYKVLKIRISRNPCHVIRNLLGKPITLPSL